MNSLKIFFLKNKSCSVCVAVIPLEMFFYVWGGSCICNIKSTKILLKWGRFDWSTQLQMTIWGLRHILRLRLELGLGWAKEGGIAWSMKVPLMIEVQGSVHMCICVCVPPDQNNQQKQNKSLWPASAVTESYISPWEIECYDYNVWSQKKVATLSETHRLWLASFFQQVTSSTMGGFESSLVLQSQAGIFKNKASPLLVLYAW